MISTKDTSSEFASSVGSSVDQALYEFSRDVLKGFTSYPKSLPPKYFYDELGSILFQAICRVPEYYVTRDEEEILRTSADKIVKECKSIPGSTVNLIELGSGSSEKTRYLIEALLRLNTSLCYRAIDVSSESLRLSQNALLQTYPNLSFVPYPYDYFTALIQVARDISLPGQTSDFNIGVFFGSSIGNLEPDEAESLLKAMRPILRTEDSFLVGADLRKSSDILLPAYNDGLGITAAFNMNLLVRINRELGGTFDLRKFEHRSIFNEKLSRIEMHLFSREKQVITIKALSAKIPFEAGESIHTESSYKFELNALARLAAETGFNLTQTWFDKNQHYSLNCLQPSTKD
jgi:dimethylhistidine N-methyltransferase